MVHTKTNPASHPNTQPITFTERDAKCNSCCHKQEDQQQLSFLSVSNHSLVVRMHERGVSVKKFPGFLTKLVLSRIDGAAEAARLQSAQVRGPTKLYDHKLCFRSSSSPEQCRKRINMGFKNKLLCRLYM